MGAETWRRRAMAGGALAIVLDLGWGLGLGCKHGAGPQPDAPSDVPSDVPSGASRPPPGTRVDTWPEILGGGTDLFPRAAGTAADEGLPRDPAPPHPPDAQVPLRGHGDDARDGDDGGRPTERP